MTGSIRHYINLVETAFHTDSAPSMTDPQPAAPPLPMDPASRAERAVRLGFTIDAFHGTASDFAAFDRKHLGSGVGSSDTKLGFNFTSDPTHASEYTWKNGDLVGNVIPVKLRLDHPRVVDVKGGTYNPELWNTEIRAALAAGNDGVVFRNMKSLFDAYKPDAPRITDYIVFSPSQVRSRFAAFDPDKLDSPDLMA